MIEDNLAVICACLPMCRTPLAMLFPSIFSSTITSASSSRPKTGYGPSSGSHPLSLTGTRSGDAADPYTSRHGGWSELQTFSTEKSAVRTSVVSLGRPGSPLPAASNGVELGGDGGSEEYILATSPVREGSRSSQAEAGGEAVGDEEEGGVKAGPKLTRLELSYGAKPGSAY
jgi:hypothetical protein